MGGSPGLTPVPFSRAFFAEDAPFAVLGGGRVGGKAGGLALALERIVGAAGAGLVGATVELPRLVVLGTDVFESFMQRNHLRAAIADEDDDDRIARAFLAAPLPATVVGDLMTLAERVRVPLAVRSSSLLEDALGRPFAGVYATKMTPNDQVQSDGRFRALVEAVKLVWASTYFRAARGYRRRVGADEDSESMAVIVQQVAGSRHADRFYPHVSVVARSYNYYATGNAAPEDGLAILALGLGRTIVNGEAGWSYSPAYPKAPPPVNRVAELVDQSQQEFWAVAMGPVPYDPVRETEHLRRWPLSTAEADDTLRFVAATYDGHSDRLVPGISAPGPRVLNFAPLLQYGQYAVNDAIVALLRASEDAVGGPVELEAAVRLEPSGMARVGFLQVRPTAGEGEAVEVGEGDLERDDLLTWSTACMGNGRAEDMADVVYLRPEVLSGGGLAAAAREIAEINERLVGQGRRYLLIGFGRWGTSDGSAGVQVRWDEISGAGAIVEIPLAGAATEPSQGSHFFHNLTSFECLYLSVEDRRLVDWSWLEAQRTETETATVRHVRLGRPLAVAVDGRSRRGVIIRHD